VSGKRALKLLLSANKRLNTAYMLKESFGQLRNYEREAWARKFFENWRAWLKWQRLKRYEKFAAMIDEHWDGIAAYCKPENKVSLGYVEGLNGRIRVIQRRASVASPWMTCDHQSVEPADALAPAALFITPAPSRDAEPQPKQF